MHRACRPTSLVVLSFAAALAGCGGASAGPPDHGTEAAALPVAETVVEEAPAGADGEAGEGHASLLGGLHEEDALTYRVHRANGEALDVRMRISRVIERGGSIAVKLSPLGTELTETTPIFPHWIIGNVEGLFGLEQHVSLTEPGFVPLDEHGEMVTEAASNVAWHVPPDWFEASSEARAFDTDPVEGWTLAGHRDHVEGTVRGERCVQLEREEGDLRRRMLVCANVGMVESAMSGATDEDPYTWRLVDLGGPRSPELTEN